MRVPHTVAVDVIERALKKARRGGLSSALIMTPILLAWMRASPEIEILCNEIGFFDVDPIAPAHYNIVEAHYTSMDSFIERAIEPPIITIDLEPGVHTLCVSAELVRVRGRGEPRPSFCLNSKTTATVFVENCHVCLSRQNVPAVRQWVLYGCDLLVAGRLRADIFARQTRTSVQHACGCTIIGDLVSDGVLPPRIGPYSLRVLGAPRERAHSLH